MSFTEESLDAANALACGLMTKVVPPAELIANAMNLAAASPSTRPTRCEWPNA